jgi:ribosomal protein S18 acetylase RimI-like enzyme
VTRRVEVGELGHVPFVRHQVDPAQVEGAWRAGGAAAVLAHRPLPQGRVLAVHGFGADDDLAPLLERLAADGVRPDRVMVDADAATIPAAWPLTELRSWHWMLSTTPPPEDPLPVERVDDEDEVTALLDAEAPDSLARPGTPGVESWHGVREEGVLVAVGAVVRQPDGTGHLRAVTVASRLRGRGIGRALSTALTRLARAGTGVASLGVYTDNEPALRIYRDLGYAVAHTFRSGPVSASSITTAAAPSR